MQIQRVKNETDKRTPPAGTFSDRAKAPREIDPELRRQMVAEAAYYGAMNRGFAPGHEVEDWTAAEREVEGMLHGRPSI